MVDTSKKTTLKINSGFTDLGNKFEVSKVKSKVLLDSPSGSILFDVMDILYVEVLGKTMEIHLKKRNHLKMKFSMNDYRQFLLSQDFMQVDEFLVVNINHIQKYQLTGVPYIELGNGLKKRISTVYHEVIIGKIKKLEQIK